MNKIQLHASWRKKLDGEFDCEYMLALQTFLTEQKAQGKLMYPPEKQIFNALNSTAFEDVKVIIIGQDPYHGAGQAHGLCFSVPQGLPIPPSLVNIFKELNNDVGCSAPEHGCLQDWNPEALDTERQESIRCLQVAPNIAIGSSFDPGDAEVCCRGLTDRFVDGGVRG